MTSGMVTDVNSIVNIGITPSVSPTDNQGSAFKDTFKVATDSKESGINKNDPKPEVKMNNLKSDKSNVKISSQKSKIDEISDEKIDEAISDKAAIVAEAISAELGVTVEEVQAAMEELGLGNADLLTVDGINAVIAEIANLENPIDMVIDPEISQAIANVGEVLNQSLTELSEKLDIPSDEVANLINTKVDAPKAFEMPVTDENVADENVTDENVTDENVTDDSLLVNEMGNAADNEKVKATDDAENNNSSDLMNKEHVDVKAEDADKSKGNNETPVVTTNVSFENGNVVITKEVTNAEGETRVSTQEIIGQITDYMQSHSEEGLSEIRMQLHPESLGTLLINVTSKNGNITASIIAQNEAVKAALESAITTLEDNFKEQGVKIDAVEVSVGTHEFEQAMENNAGSNGSNNAEPNEIHQASKTKIRRINLADEMAEGEETEELSEEDTIAREMLIASGNTLDYRA
ncbi:MAG: flagellar hook-length control protein FliK [Lachnospiraceae bacterium]|nr:flagellar hook-length control protein FliK [Lachnospiraceae bacterium]